jgi:hypothetical protein
MAKKEFKNQSEEMSLEEAKAYRAANYKPEAKALSDQEKREEFRLFWAQQRKKYGKSKELEQILWLHLKAVKLDSPEQFDQGVAHFGLKKVR